MAKMGVREMAVQLFAERVVLRGTETYPTDTHFRKSITTDLAELFDISIGSASSAYNYAKIAYSAAHPEHVVGLGRAPEKNNGGRKKKQEAAVAAEAETAMLLLGDERPAQAQDVKVVLADSWGNVIEA